MTRYRIILFPMLIALSAVGLLGSCKGDGDEADAGPDMRADGLADQRRPDLMPPDADLSKRPHIDRIEPDNGFTAATTLVVLTGTNFAKGMTIFIDGKPQALTPSVTSSSSMSFSMPMDPYGAPSYDQPHEVDVRVQASGLLSNIVSFQYTVSKPMDATFKGKVVTTTAIACYKDFPSESIRGSVFAEGISDTTTGESSQLRAHLGYGPVGSDPSKDAGWKWLDARFEADDGASDVYSGQITVAVAQTYDVAFRFSKDVGGETWIYADPDDTNLAYEPDKALKLTASVAPAGYCQVAADCAIYPFKVACKVDPADKSQNRCVECLGDGDCQSPKSLGPHCDTAENQCYCTDPAECTSNPNGPRCDSGYCGCADENDCPGKKCIEVLQLAVCQ